MELSNLHKALVCQVVTGSNPVDTSHDFFRFMKLWQDWPLVARHLGETLIEIRWAVQESSLLAEKMECWRSGTCWSAAMNLY